MKRTWRSGVKIGDKRIFEHSFDKAKLDKEHYFCDTLEPTWRNLLGVELKPEEEDGRYSRVSGKKARKIPRSEERRVGKECRSRWSPYH